MVPLKDVSCFGSVHFRVPAFWTWQRSGRFWGFWREDEDPESGSGRLLVTHHVAVSDGEAGRQSEKLGRHSRDRAVDGRVLRSHRWDRVAYDGQQLSFTFFDYVIQADLADRPDIAEIRAVLDREIENALYSSPAG